MGFSDPWPDRLFTIFLLSPGTTRLFHSFETATLPSISIIGVKFPVCNLYSSHTTTVCLCSSHFVVLPSVLGLFDIRVRVILISLDSFSGMSFRLAWNYTIEQNSGLGVE